MGVSSLAPVADNVQATDHLADGEEAKDLGGGHTSQGKLLRASVAGTSQEVLGRGEVEALDGGRVAGDVDQGLEVGLEGGGRAVEIGMVKSWEQVDGNLIAEAEREGGTYGGVMFWPRNTSLPSSRPTLE